MEDFWALKASGWKTGDLEFFGGKDIPSDAKHGVILMIC